MDVALLEFGDDGVEAAGEEAKVEHLAVGEAVEELVQPLQDDRPVDGELVELGGYSVVSRDFTDTILVTLLAQINRFAKYQAGQLLGKCV